MVRQFEGRMHIYELTKIKKVYFCAWALYKNHAKQDNIRNKAKLPELYLTFQLDQEWMDTLSGLYLHVD
jgi:hemolysin-activating ACP:hemolysin acyltransferase